MKLNYLTNYFYSAVKRLLEVGKLFFGYAMKEEEEERKLGVIQQSCLQTKMNGHDYDELYHSASQPATTPHPCARVKRLHAENLKFLVSYVSLSTLCEQLISYTNNYSM